MHKVSRPTVRLDVDFHEKLTIELKERGITFQELTEKLLTSWLENHKNKVGYNEYI